MGGGRRACEVLHCDLCRGRGAVEEALLSINVPSISLHVQHITEYRWAARLAYPTGTSVRAAPDIATVASSATVAVA